MVATQDRRCVSCHLWIGIARLQALEYKTSLCISCAQTVSKLHNRVIVHPLPEPPKPTKLIQIGMWDQKPKKKKIRIVFSRIASHYMMPLEIVMNSKPRVIKTKISPEDNWEVSINPPPEE